MQNCLVSMNNGKQGKKGGALTAEDAVIFHQLEILGKDGDAPTGKLCQACSKSGYNDSS